MTIIRDIKSKLINTVFATGCYTYLLVWELINMWKWRSFAVDEAIQHVIKLHHLRIMNWTVDLIEPACFLQAWLFAIDKISVPLI